jgi:hypothetical protein
MYLMDFYGINCKNYGINIILVYELVLYMKAVLYFSSVKVKQSCYRPGVVWRVPGS